VYQLWLVRGNSPQPKPSSVFVVARDGRGTAAIPGGLAGARQVLVSVEPQGGSKSPTSKPVLRATL
jgi:anti-sigma-K factor RskA